MEGNEERIARRKAGANQKIANAFAHLVGSFIGERDSENAFAGRALLDHVGNAVGDDARLAGARACENQHWAIDGEDSFALLGIQGVQKIHVSR